MTDTVTDNGSDNENDIGNSITEHVDQSIPFEWRAFEHAGEILVVHDVPESTVMCYRVSGATRNARVMALTDAVLYEGSLVEPFYNDDRGIVYLQHAFAGTKGRFRPAEWTDNPVVCLETCDSPDIEMVIDNGA